MSMIFRNDWLYSEPISSADSACPTDGTSAGVEVGAADVALAGVVSVVAAGAGVSAGAKKINSDSKVEINRDGTSTGD